MNPFKENLRKLTKTVDKAWGSEHYVINDQEHGYCGKVLVVNGGQGFGWHFHRDKTETFLVKGKIKVWLKDTSNREVFEQVLETDAVLDIPVLTPHKIEALEDSMIIEFSTFHRDEDSYRI